jgi:hypothetical protein
MTELEESLYGEKVLPEVQTVNAKIYTVNQIRICTFFGGPLVAGYMIAENFRAFNEYGKAKQTWLIAIVASVVIFGLLFAIPESVKIPNVLFPLIYSWATFMLVNKYQGKQIMAHLTGDGLSFNWGRAIVVSLIGMVTIVVLVFIGVFVADMVSYGQLSQE